MSTGPSHCRSTMENRNENECAAIAPLHGATNAERNRREIEEAIIDVKQIDAGDSQESARRRCARRESLGPYEWPHEVAVVAVKEWLKAHGLTGTRYADEIERFRRPPRARSEIPFASSEHGRRSSGAMR
ncbi:MAG: hypothetical protein JXQ75_04635 [Phycisphaerae bacterium]|nr:hypothetical protein [Phycisphaerae bacterium]